MEGEKIFASNYVGFLRRRHLLQTEKNIAFNLNQAALNLSPREYQEMLEGIKKRGNMR